MCSWGIHRVDRAQTARKHFLASNEGTVCTPHQKKISMITLHRVDRAQGARIFSLASNCETQPPASIG